jgi:protein-disulfide isomerase
LVEKAKLAVEMEAKAVARARNIEQRIQQEAQSPFDASHAALAAKRQGKYHEFHVALMSAEQADENSVAATARALGLDYAQLVKDMGDPAIEEQLERNYRLATAIGINGTPAFVIGDRLVPGAVDEAAMMEIIATERAKMKAAPQGN